LRRPQRLTPEGSFTAGADECKCWTIRTGTLLQDAGGVIHSDFVTKFICAEVTQFRDFKEAGGSEVRVKEAGKVRTLGRGHQVQDGDILFFKINKG